LWLQNSLSAQNRIIRSNSKNTDIYVINTIRRIIRLRRMTHPWYVDKKETPTHVRTHVRAPCSDARNLSRIARKAALDVGLSTDHSHRRHHSSHHHKGPRCVCIYVFVYKFVGVYVAVGVDVGVCVVRVCTCMYFFAYVFLRV